MFPDIDKQMIEMAILTSGGDLNGAAETLLQKSTEGIKAALLFSLV